MVRGMKAGRTRVVATWHGSQGAAFVNVVSQLGGGKRGHCASAGAADQAVSVPKPGPGPCPLSRVGAGTANDSRQTGSRSRVSSSSYFLTTNALTSTESLPRNTTTL
jgi:hypothetical protein